MKVSVFNFTHPAAPNSVSRYYSIIPIGSGICDLTFFYKDSELNGQTEENLKVWKYNNGNWTKYIPSNIDTDSNLIKIEGISDFSDWILSSAEDDISLPVVISLFKAKSEKNKIKLTWTTESEINNIGFNVYKTEDGYDSLYYQLNSKIIKGAGNSSEKREYKFIDNKVEYGKNYWYKLESIDYNGNSEFSEPISAKLVLPTDYSLSQNYPNPFNINTAISYQIPKSSKVEINIYDIKGRLVKNLVDKHQNAGYYTVFWNANNISSGIYFIKINAGEFIKVNKCIVVK